MEFEKFVLGTKNARRFEKAKNSLTAGDFSITIQFVPLSDPFVVLPRHTKPPQLVEIDFRLIFKDFYVLFLLFRELCLPCKSEENKKKKNLMKAKMIFWLLISGVELISNKESCGSQEPIKVKVACGFEWISARVAKSKRLRRKENWIETSRAFRARKWSAREFVIEAIIGFGRCENNSWALRSIRRLVSLSFIHLDSFIRFRTLIIRSIGCIISHHWLQQIGAEEAKVDRAWIFSRIQSAVNFKEQNNFRIQFKWAVIRLSQRWLGADIYWSLWPNIVSNQTERLGGRRD